MTLRTTPAHMFGSNDTIEVVRTRDHSDPDDLFDVVTVRIGEHEFDLPPKDAAQLAAGVTHALVL